MRAHRNPRRQRLDRMADPAPRCSPTSPSADPPTLAHGELLPVDVASSVVRGSNRCACVTKLRTALAADAAVSPFGGRIVPGVWLVEVHVDVLGFLVLLGGGV